jgi:hypothetical protein
MIQHMQESFGETIMMSWPIKDYPLNIRPVRQYLQYDDERWTLTKGLQVVIFLTGAWLILLGILGMAPLPTIPINDKALHFFGVSRIYSP